MKARTAHLVKAGGYLPTGVRVPKGHWGVWCPACEYARVLPRNLTEDEADKQRRLHVGYVHLFSLTAGAMVLDESLA